MLKRLYLVGAVLGFVLPYAFFIPWLLDNGLNISLFVQNLFANQAAAMFTVDLLVSSFVLWIFIFSEGRKLGMRNLWVYVVCNLLVGLSFALPLFLYVRERQLESASSRAAVAVS